MLPLSCLVVVCAELKRILSIERTLVLHQTPIISGLNLFRMRNAPPNGYAVPPPISGVDKQDRDDISDTSFVLPELGGPNPHNKFDGMEWVDIKGLDDETLQDISTDLRKLQQLG